MLRRWSEKEVETLGKLYPTEKPMRVANHLQRSVSSVHHKASRLGISSYRFPSDRREMIERLYWKKWMNLEETGEELGVTQGAIRSYMVRHGIPRRGIWDHLNRWSREEDEVLRKNYGKTAVKEMKRFLPNRSCIAIRSRAKKMGFQTRILRWDRCSLLAF